MTLKELQKKVEFYTSHGHENDVVAVKLSEPSVGALAKEDVENIFPGIDWDNGVTFINTQNKVTSYKKDRDVPLSVVEITYRRYPETKPVLHCPKCSEKVRRTDKYCCKCGQAITTENMRKMEI